MTAHKHFKAVVRARMARTGETYTAARAALTRELGRVRLEPVATIDAHDRHCVAVRFTPDGRELLTGGFSGQAHIWSTSDWSRAGELAGHGGSVNAFALDRSGVMAVTVSSDGTVRRWDVPARREVALLASSRKAGLAVDLRPDGGLAATGGLDETIRFHALDGGDAPAPIRAEGRVTSLAWSPDGERLAAATAGAGTALLDVDGAVSARLEDPATALNVRWAAGGALLAITGLGGSVAVVDAATLDVVRRVELGLQGVLPVATSPDGALVAIGWERHVAVWRADEDEPVATIGGLPKGVYALDISPDGRLLAQGGADGRVRIWRLGPPAEGV